jgi:hypothetical protein
LFKKGGFRLKECRNDSNWVVSGQTLNKLDKPAKFPRGSFNVFFTRFSALFTRGFSLEKVSFLHG